MDLVGPSRGLSVDSSLEDCKRGSDGPMSERVQPYQRSNLPENGADTLGERSRQVWGRRSSAISGSLFESAQTERTNDK